MLNIIVTNKNKISERHIPLLISLSLSDSSICLPKVGATEVGDMVGAGVGAFGAKTGDDVEGDWVEGAALGDNVLRSVGARVGAYVGLCVGCPDGWPDGWPGGWPDGQLLGWLLGCADGLLVGRLEGWLLS